MIGTKMFGSDPLGDISSNSRRTANTRAVVFSLLDLEPAEYAMYSSCHKGWCSESAFDHMFVILMEH